MIESIQQELDSMESPQYVGQRIAKLNSKVPKFTGEARKSIVEKIHQWTENPEQMLAQEKERLETYLENYG